MTTVPMMRRETAPAPVAIPQRHGSQNKCERGHENWPQANARAGQRRFNEWFAFFVFEPRKLDDQNGIFGGEPDEHDQADLRENIVHHVPRPQGHESAQHGDRRAQQHAEWQAPAFVQRGENQEHEQERKAENRDGRNALRPLSFPGMIFQYNHSPSPAAWFARRLLPGLWWLARNCSRARRSH